MRTTNQGQGPATPTADLQATAARPYYQDLDRGCDAVVRCNDCSRLATMADITLNKGLTPCCGTRRVREIRSLGFFEWLKIRLGIIDFPHRDLFLKEFWHGRTQAVANQRSERHDA